MSAVRMDGKALSAKVRGSILAETEALKKQGVTPGLAVIIVGNDPASEIYVRNKERACEQCGFYSEKYALPEETTQEELLGLIAQLNESPAISGILCQMPVPKHISEQAVIDAIDPKKDVDAFHPSNVGRIMMRTMFLSGSISGLVGFIIVSGANHTLYDGVAGGVGFTAISVAWLAQLNPFAMIIIASMLAVLTKGSQTLNTRMQVPSTIADILTGFILLCMLGCEFFINYKISVRREKED